jgi:hypothetical protein
MILLSKSTPAAVVPETTWDASSITGSMTLSNGNLVATGGTTGNGFAGVRGTTSKTSGKWYFEFTATQIDAVLGFRCGIVTAGANAAGVGNNAQGIAVRVGFGTFYIMHNNLTAGTFTNTSADGHVYGVCLDLTNTLFWAQDLTNATGWTDGASGFTGNPASGSGGTSFAGITLPVENAFTAYNPYPATCTLNPGPSGFYRQPPAGFPAWA